MTERKPPSKAPVARRQTYEQPPLPGMERVLRGPDLTSQGVEVPDVACPSCRAQRTPSGGTALYLTRGPDLQVLPVGTYSIAGKATKLVAREVYRLVCAACGMVRVGRFEGVELVFDGAEEAGDA